MSEFQHFGVVMHFHAVRSGTNLPRSPRRTSCFLRPFEGSLSKSRDGLVVDLQHRNGDDVLDLIPTPFLGLDEEITVPAGCSLGSPAAVHGAGLARACDARRVDGVAAKDTETRPVRLQAKMHTL